MSSSSPLQKLRWRARTQKEVSIEEEAPLSRSSNNKARQLYPTFPIRVLHSATAASLMIATVYNLQILTGWYAVVQAAAILTLSGYSFWQARQLRHLGTWRRLHNQTRAQVAKVQQQKERLQRHVRALEHTTETLQSLPEALQSVTDQQSLSELQGLVQEYRELQQSTTRHLQAKAQEQILQAILTTDKDGDHSLSPTEVERLLVRLSQLPGLKVDEARLRRILRPPDLLHDTVPLVQVVQLLREASLSTSSQRSLHEGGVFVWDTTVL